MLKLTRRGAVILTAAMAVAMTVTPGNGSADEQDPAKPKTFVIHIEYGAQEDMISCPGTPYRVLAYSPLADGGALVECAYP